jgi:hypothetical protein
MVGPHAWLKAMRLRMAGMTQRHRLSASETAWHDVMVVVCG